MDTETTLLALGLAALAWLLMQPAAPTEDPAAAYDATSSDTTNTLTLDSIMGTTKSVFGLWHPPAQYAGLIADVEAQYGLPQDLLARLLFQESHYRDDIITGRVASPAGALGIAQFMPLTARDMGINPLDPVQAIPAAGRYLASLYRSTGSWSKALAAYNWGIGNVNRKGLGNAPRETVNYYTQILADVNNGTGQTLA